MTHVSASPPAGATRLDAAYARAILAADRVATRPVIAFGLLTLALVVSAAVGTLVLDRFPNSGDEYAYLYQAQTFASGRLWNPAPAAPDLFGSYYIVNDGSRAFSSFPVGWPLALAGALRLGMPPWLVNPCLGVLSLVVLFAIGRRLHGPRVAAAATFLVAISPFFLFHAGSFFSHTFTSVLVLVAAYAAVRSDDGRAWWPLLAGFAIGWAVLARYLTGVVCALPVVFLLLQRRGRPVRTLALVALGGLPWVAVLGGYNAAMSGSAWRLTTLDETYGNWFRYRWFLRGFDIFANQLLRYLIWTPPLLPFLYIACWRGDGIRRAGVLAWMPMLLAVAFFAYINRGGNQYGPRFYYEAFPFLALAVAAQAFAGDRLSGGASRARFAALAGSVVIVPLAFAGLAAIEFRVVRERQDPFRLAAAAGLTHAIVLIAGRVGSLRSMDGRDLTRNGLVVDGPVLFATDPGADEACRLNAAHYQRRLYRYRWDAVAAAGHLEPVTCAAAASASK